MHFKKIRHYYHELLLSHATPTDVAYGFAFGIFITMTPTLGLHTILAIALATFFRRNKVAAIIGAWVNNPFTIFPIFYYTYRLGQWVLRRPPHILRPESLKDIFHLSRGLITPLWIGGVVVGLISSILGYYLVLWIYPRLKQRVEELRKEI